MSDGWQISPESVRERLDDDTGGMVLVDCRTEDEFQRDHIASARLLPMQELSLRAQELDECRDCDVVVYCRTGHRSRIVARYLVLRGFSNVLSMAGGLHAWVERIDPTFECD